MNLHFYVCAVFAQRDNGPDTTNVVRQFVTKTGFSPNVEDAQIFTSRSQLTSRVPRGWTFDVYTVNQNAPQFVLMKA